MRGDALGVVGRIGTDGAARGVVIGSGNGGVLPYVQAWNGLNERRVGIEIGVRDTPIARPKAGVDGELRQIGQPSGVLIRAICLTAGQDFEIGQIDGRRSFRFEEIP